MTRNKAQVETQWDRARRCRLTVSGSRETIDPGVNFFILGLRHLGATTLFSCEGHPNGFYIVFRSTEKIARRVVSCGCVTLTDSPAANDKLSCGRKRRRFKYCVGPQPFGGRRLALFLCPSA